jgi:hypothetical protein
MNTKDLEQQNKEPRKGEQMKRLALLSVVSLMLASAVFAPVAMAQEVGEVDVQSVRLGPGGSVTVTGTIECVEGYISDVNVTVRQRSGQFNNRVDVFDSPPRPCETTGPRAFTLTNFSHTPFHRGPATIVPSGRIFSPDFSTNILWQGAIEAVHIR